MCTQCGQRRSAGSCGIDPLCEGVQACIESGDPAMHSLTETNKMEKEWEFLLIDASNAFHEINRAVMLW